MEIPDWFGVTQYYVAIVTIWFGLIIYFLTAYVRAGVSKTNLKSKVISIRDWWRKRQEAKML